MSVVFSEPETAAHAGFGTVPYARLQRVEWRKQLDTRASRWLLVVIGIVVAVTIAIPAVWDDDHLTFEKLLGGTSQPLAVLLPVVGILAATQEWSQRTALVTLVLEPRRIRVGAAKLLAAVLTGAVAVAFATALAAVAYQLRVSISGTEASWSVNGVIALGLCVSLVLSMVQGVAFGLALQNTPAAIAVFFALPTVQSVGVLIPALDKAWSWIDLRSASTALLSGTATGESWAHLATASAIWVVVPLIAGGVRFCRSEIRSS